MKKGLFIAFEGGEGAGKTTLIGGISQALSDRQIPYIRTREPGGTLLGEKIRDLLLASKEIVISSKAELMLFLAARAQNLQEIIAPSLEEGICVLCDRFNASTIAYQGWARGLGFQEVSKICAYISEEMVPDLTFYLDIDPRVGLTRAAKVSEQDRMESEEILFHEKVREGFLKISKSQPETFIMIDAEQSREAILDEVFARIAKRLEI